MERIGVGVDHQKQNIFTLDQGDINFGASSQADFILNHFLSKFPSNFLSNSPSPPSPAGRLEQLMSSCSWLTYLFSTIWVIWQDFTVPHNSARSSDLYKGNNTNINIHQTQTVSKAQRSNLTYDKWRMMDDNDKAGQVALNDTFWKFIFHWIRPKNDSIQNSIQN